MFPWGLDPIFCIIFLLEILWRYINLKKKMWLSSRNVMWLLWSLNFRCRFYCRHPRRHRKSPVFRDGDNILGTLAFCDVANRVANHKTRRKSLFIVGTPRRATNRVANRAIVGLPCDRALINNFREWNKLIKLKYSFL